MKFPPCNSKTDSHGRELTEHGTTLFPAAYYAVDLEREGVPWHWHDELEVAVVTRGTTIAAADAERYHLRPGDAIFINADALHTMWDTTHSGCQMHTVTFHPRLVGGSIDSIFWQRYVLPLLENPALKAMPLDGSAPWHRQAVEAIEAAWQSCGEQQPGYEFQVRAALSQLIFLLSTHCPSAPLHPSEKALRDDGRIKTMLQYIQTHYAEELTTQAIAQSALISDSECLRCFHNTIGTTPIQYLKQFRIQKAAELLSNTNEKISDIGADCGFQDMSYFTKSFRTAKGCTPSEYRLQKSRE